MSDAANRAHSTNGDTVAGLLSGTDALLARVRASLAADPARWAQYTRATLRDELLDALMDASQVAREVAGRQFRRAYPALARWRERSLDPQNRRRVSPADRAAAHELLALECALLGLDDLAAAAHANARRALGLAVSGVPTADASDSGDAGDLGDASDPSDSTAGSA